MNLDNLISKYLDGELTHQEDLYLRELISNDDIARDKFNSYVDIHLAAKEDSKDIEVPEDLISDTEDMVMMKIMDQTPALGKTAGSSSFRTFSFKITSMVAAILIIAVLPISDMNFFNERVQSLNSINSEISLIDVKVPQVSLSEINNSSAENQSEINTPESSEQFAAISTALEQLSSEKAKDEELPDLSTLENNSEVLAENEESDSKNDNTIYFEDKSENKERKIASQPISINLASPVTTNFTSMNMDEKINAGSLNNISVNNVEINTTAYSPVSVMGFAPEANASISSFSQSLALVLNDDERFGVEIGYSDLNYVAENNTYIKVYDKYGRYTGDQIVTKTQSDRDFSLYWGSIFYQREIFEYKDFNLNMRLGAGLTNEGPTANSRLVASYQIVNGVSITAGADLNYFNVELPFLINRRTNHYMSFSTVYGVQFNF